MRTSVLLLAAFALFATHRFAAATQADDTTIDITAQNAGASPFIAKLTLSTDNLSVLERLQFTIAPKAGSVTRPLSGTYARTCLNSRGFVNASAGELTLPVFGLYDSYMNHV